MVAVASVRELYAYHQKNNRDTAAGWSLFSTHRQHLGALIEAAGGQEVALLGAGNCNDVDLERLAETCDRLALFDLDEGAVRRARDRQAPAVARKLELFAPVDLSGVFDRLPGLVNRRLGLAELEAFGQRALEQASAALPPRRFDTVVSCCVLSQIMHSLYLGLGRHPQLEDLVEPVALAHVRLLLRLVRPGGHALLVTDVVSTETYPLEELWAERTPAALLSEVDRTGNTLNGTGPTFLRRMIARAGVDLAEPPRPSVPWLWPMGEDLTLLTYALCLKPR